MITFKQHLIENAESNMQIFSHTTNILKNFLKQLPQKLFNKPSYKKAMDYLVNGINEGKISYGTLEGEDYPRVYFSETNMSYYTTNIVNPLNELLEDIEVWEDIDIRNKKASIPIDFKIADSYTGGEYENRNFFSSGVLTIYIDPGYLYKYGEYENEESFYSIGSLTISHELRHLYDDYLNKKIAIYRKPYIVDNDSDDGYAKYRLIPIEINAFFTQSVLKAFMDMERAGYDYTKENMNQFLKLFKKEYGQKYIDDMDNKTKKRILSRAYKDYMDIAE